MNKQQSVVLTRDKDCKHSVRFATKDDQAPVSSIYVNRFIPGVNAARTVTMTLEVDGVAASPAPKAAQVPALATLRVPVAVIEGAPVTDDAALLAAIG